MIKRDRTRRPLHRDDQRQFADQGTGARNDFGAAVLDADRAALNDIAGIRLVAGVEQIIAGEKSRCSEPIASMRSAVVPNRRNVGTRSSRATSSSIDMDL